MPKDFQGANLRGRSFAGESLTGANFSKADLRGVDFSKAVLTRADFTGATIGVSPFWFLVLTLGAFLLTVLTSLIIAYASVLVTIPLQDSPFNSVLEISLSFALALVFVGVVVKKGLGSTLGACGIALGAMIPVVIALTQVATGSIAEYVVIAVVVKSIGLAGIVAGIITGSVIVAISRARTNRAILILVIGLAGLAAYLGITEGIRNAKINAPLVWLFSTALTLAAFVISVYIARLADRENPKFSLIKSLAIVITTLKGTQFRFTDLTDADFTQATLKSANFSFANLTRTRWFQSQGLEKSLVKGTYLDNPAIRNLVISGEGQGRNFDYQNLQGLNLRGAQLSDASFIGAALSNADLQEADLSRAKLAKAQLYNTRLNRACLTGANIQDWAISLDTEFEDVQCDYVYMHLPTLEDQDPYRKPDNRDEFFRPGDFADFITPIIKTLDLYQRQNVDPRAAAQTYKTIDLFHHEGIDPGAAAIAIQRLAEQYPEAGLEVVALEGRGNEKVRLQARVSHQADPSELSKEYFERYREVKDLAYSDLQALLRGIEEKDQRIRSLEEMVLTAIQQKTFYVETYQNMGDTVTEKSSININAGGDIGSLSGIVSGNVSGVMNLGTISGNVSNTINQISEDSEEKAELKALLQRLQSAIETEPELSPEDKAEALEQVQTLAKAGQDPEDGPMQKAAKTAIKILKGTTAGLSETTKLVGEFANLLPAISGLLLLL
jgi:uncharacterized protein YjbI with pentapeptide repeats